MDVTGAEAAGHDNVGAIRALKLDLHGLGLAVPAKRFCATDRLPRVNIPDGVATRLPIQRAVVHVKSSADVLDVRAAASVVLAQADAHRARLAHL